METVKHTIVLMLSLGLLSIQLAAQRIQIDSLSAIEYIDHPLEGVDHGHAFVDMTMLPGADVEYLNMHITDENGNVEWSIRNMPIPPLTSPEPISYLVDLTDLGGNQGEKFLDWNTSPDWFPFNTWIPAYTDIALPVSIFHRMPSGATDPPITDLITFPPIWIPPPLPPDLTFNYRGCEVPNIDLDSTKNNPSNVPGIPDDKLACGPAAAANSLQWLSDRHPEIAAMDPTDLRGKCDSLKKYMDKDNIIGVRFDSMVTGKLRLIDQLGLPIKVKYQTEHASGAGPFLRSADPRYAHVAENQTGPSGAPDWDWLKNEIDSGEDVELQYGVYAENADGDVVRDYGHWVVLTGYFDLDTLRGIWFKEDNDQLGAGGQRQRLVEWGVDDDGYIFLRTFFGNEPLLAYVESVVSESYDSTVSFVDLTLFELDFIPIDPAFGDALNNPDHALLSFVRPIDFAGSTEYLFCNARAINPNNGTSVWAARNVPMFPYQGARGAYRMDLADVTDMNGIPANLLLEIKIGEYEACEDFVPQGILSLPQTPIQQQLGGLSIFEPQIIPNASTSDVTVLGPNITGEYLRENVPNVDLDDIAYPDPQTGDWNACGQAATANSMKWLMLDNDSIPDIDSLRGIFEDLKTRIPRDADGYCTWQGMVEGKLSYIDSHELKIHVKYQTYRPTDDTYPTIPSPNPNYGHEATNETPVGGFPDYEWIKSELNAGEDVEMTLQPYCRNATGQWVAQPGHAVNVIGHNSNSLIDDWLHINHDLDQWGPGGMVEECVQWLHDDQGRPYIRELNQSENRITYVGPVISESFDPNIGFCTDDVFTPGDKGAGSFRKVVGCSEAGDTIWFKPIMNGQTISLTSEPILIDHDVVILADPTIDITVSAAAIQRCLVIAEGVSVEIIGLDLIGGTALQGAAILNFGNLILQDLEVENSNGEFVPSLIINSSGQLKLKGQTNFRED